MNEKALLYLYGWIEGTIGERLFSFADFKLAAAHAEALGIANNISAVLRIGGEASPPDFNITATTANAKIQEDILARIREQQEDNVVALYTETHAPTAPVLPKTLPTPTWQPLKRGRGNNFAAGAKIRLKSDWKEICESNSYGVALENIEYDNTVFLGEEYIVESYVDDGSLSAPLQLDLTDEMGNQIDLFWTEYKLWEILR